MTTTRQPQHRPDQPTPTSAKRTVALALAIAAALAVPALWLGAHLGTLPF